MSLKEKYAIVGVGNTRQGRIPEFNRTDLHVLAIKDALEDAGLSIRDVDGYFCRAPASPSLTGYVFGQGHENAQRLGMKPKVCATIEQMGSASAALVQYAVACIEAGLCEVALISHADTPVTGTNPFRKMPAASDGGAWGKFISATWYAYVAQRHMYEFGTTSRQLGAISVADHKHGALNPKAHMPKVITLEDHQNSRMIARPLRLYDCCLISDGAGALIVTSAGRARSLRKSPVYVMGYGQSHDPTYSGYRKNIVETPVKGAADMAFQTAGVARKDIDFVEAYDCFTITGLVIIEDSGFCRKGEGGPFVEGGRLELGGELPYNTGGGLLSESGLSGILLIVEAVRQLRGECGRRQVNGAEIGLVVNQGGALDAASTLILRR